MSDPIVLERGHLRLSIGRDPVEIDIHRASRRLVRGLGLWAAAGESRDRFIQLTEGVIAAEELERPLRLTEMRVECQSHERLVLHGELGRVRLELHDERLVIDFAAGPPAFRSGSIVVTYPAGHVASGLGDTPERERPLEATLYGEPRLGRAGARLADGTRIRWRDGRWSVTPEREVRFAVAGQSGRSAP